MVLSSLATLLKKIPRRLCKALLFQIPAPVYPFLSWRRILCHPMYQASIAGVPGTTTGHIPYPIASTASILPIKRSNFHPGRHDRTVFNEVGTPLHDLDNLSDLFQGLADATIGKISVDFVLNICLTSNLTLALEIIHRLKRVYRDVSTGNILLYQGVGRLSDLEFLKEVSSLQSHEVKTVCLHASLWQAVPSNTTA